MSQYAVCSPRFCHPICFFGPRCRAVCQQAVIPQTRQHTSRALPQNGTGKNSWGERTHVAVSAMLQTARGRVRSGRRSLPSRHACPRSLSRASLLFPLACSHVVCGCTQLVCAASRASGYCRGSLERITRHFERAGAGACCSWRYLVRMWCQYTRATDASRPGPAWWAIRRDLIQHMYISVSSSLY